MTTCAICRRRSIVRMSHRCLMSYRSRQTHYKLALVRGREYSSRKQTARLTIKKTPRLERSLIGESRLIKSIN